MIIDIESILSFRQLGKRENQEDARWPDVDTPSTETAAFVVCDGVGGSRKGEVASSTVCAKIGELMSRHRNIDHFSDDDFKRILQKSYEALDNISNASNRGMGTTLTFLAFHNRGALAAHIGDSRIYQIRPGEGIIYRSEDHSLVNALLRSGNISPEQVKNHPKSNVITRCMGADDGVRERDEATVVNLQDIAPGDYFLLCSDGVSGLIDDEDLITVYSSDKTDKEKYNWLLRKCAESDDNNTLMQIHVGLVTVTPLEEKQDANEPSDPVLTWKIQRKDDSVHDLAPGIIKTKSRLKSFLSTIFGIHK